MNKKKAKIISKIIKCKSEIDNLKQNIDKCDSIMRLYNRKIVEKAILTDELKHFEDNFVMKIVKKVMPKHERTIDDYFIKL